jgi:lysozyme
VSGDTVDGVDFCNIQGDIDFRKMATEPAGPNRPAMRFCYIKSSQYSSTRDNRYSRYAEDATEAGLYVGAYHFIAVVGDPFDQAKFFYEACEGQGARAGELPPMLDFEFVTQTAPKEAVEWVERFALAVDNLWYPSNRHVRATLAREPLSGPGEGTHATRQPLIYTYPNFAQKMEPYLSSSILTRLPLCMASYGSHERPWYPNEGQKPVMAKGWQDWKLWQYSGNKGMRVPGVKVDCDRLLFKGSEDDLREFAGLPRLQMSGGSPECKQ